jgi:hypothetical protein
MESCLKSGEALKPAFNDNCASSLPALYPPSCGCTSFHSIIEYHHLFIARRQDVDSRGARSANQPHSRQIAGPLGSQRCAESARQAAASGRREGHHNCSEARSSDPQTEQVRQEQKGRISENFTLIFMLDSSQAPAASARSSRPLTTPSSWSHTYRPRFRPSQSSRRLSSVSSTISAEQSQRSLAH